jgi:hypothetical protein
MAVDLEQRKNAGIELDEIKLGVTLVGQKILSGFEILTGSFVAGVAVLRAVMWQAPVP